MTIATRTAVRDIVIVPTIVLAVEVVAILGTARELRTRTAVIIDRLAMRRAWADVTASSNGISIDAVVVLISTVTTPGALAAVARAIVVARLVLLANPVWRDVGAYQATCAAAVFWAAVAVFAYRGLTDSVVADEAGRVKRTATRSQYEVGRQHSNSKKNHRPDHPPHRSR